MRVRTGDAATIMPSLVMRARSGRLAAVSSANSQLRLCGSSITT